MRAKEGRDERGRRGKRDGGERGEIKEREKFYLFLSHTNHPRPFVGVSQKSIFNRPCQVLAINAHKMAPRTG